MQSSLECDLDFEIQIKSQLQRITLAIVAAALLLLLHHLLLLLHLHLLLLPGLVRILHLLHGILLLLSLSLAAATATVGRGRRRDGALSRAVGIRRRLGFGLGRHRGG